VKLSDVADLMASRQGIGMTYEAFNTHPTISELHSPADVVEQFLYDHGDNYNFLIDYGHIDLLTVIWSLERLPV